MRVWQHSPPTAPAVPGCPELPAIFQLPVVNGSELQSNLTIKVRGRSGVVVVFVTVPAAVGEYPESHAHQYLHNGGRPDQYELMFDNEAHSE